MMASIAHEIKQPLGAIVASANACRRWLNKSPPEIDEARDQLAHIAASGHRASDVIESVRCLFSNNDQQRTLFDANELIRETIAIVRGELDEADVRVEYDLNMQLPMLSAHKGQIQQVLLNIVTNAADAMRAVTDRARVLRVKSETSIGSGVTIAVEDSCTGIEANNTDRLFNAFFTTKANGMGMGLAICKSIIEAHGGKLSVSANAPHGSIFCVVLPEGG